jgi:hypothetical protein
MKIISKASIGLCCFLLSAFTVICEAKEGEPHWTQTLAEKNSPYPILDSGVWADWMGFDSVYWIDNNRVLFVGGPVESGRKHPQLNHVAVWEIGKSITVLSKPAQHVAICAHDGFIAYTLTTHDKNRIERFEGKFRHEKNIPPETPPNHVYSPMDCRTFEDPALAAAMQNSDLGPSKLRMKLLKKSDGYHEIIRLMDRHGYLDFGLRKDSNRGKPTLYYRKASDKPISLPYINRDITYYQFKNAYFFHPLGKNITGYDFLWLYPDGRTEEIKFPNVSDKKLVYSGKYYTRKGFFVYYEGRATSFDVPGNTGGYLVTEDGKSSKIISGYLNGITVSPDGCKITFIHYPYRNATRIDDPGRVTLKAINFCVEEQKP